MSEFEKIRKLKAALNVVLDQVDYQKGNCRPNEHIGAVLSPTVIGLARNVLEETK